MVQAGYEHVLIVGADTLSRIIDPDDRTTTVLFGDGAGAAVLAPTHETPGVLAFDLGCDGSGASLLEVRAGGSRLTASAATVAGGEHYMKMSGPEVYRRAVRAVVESAQLTLERAGIDPDEVAWFVPHQANARIIEAAGSRLGFEPERTLVNLDRY
jgi:3-oxoacyl-[acyl-carrier-protein] synthase-3